MDWIYCMNGENAEIQFSRMLSCELDSQHLRSYKFRASEMVKSPWMVDEETERQHVQLTIELDQSVLDECSWLILSILALFDDFSLSVECAAKIKPARAHFEKLLFRYLKSLFNEEDVSAKFSEQLQNIQRIRVIEYNMEHKRLQI